MLVVSCPCAIALAFPLADEMATVALRRRGVFVRDGNLYNYKQEVGKAMAAGMGIVLWIGGRRRFGPVLTVAAGVYFVVFGAWMVPALAGDVTAYSFDPATGRAAGVQIQATMQLTLTERATGKVLYNRPSFDFRERYEVSVDQQQYFEESEQALERLSRDAARTLVSAILTAF